ncbi:MAG TPA: hypothetical protein VFC56_19260 [Stellaceae bacterium]|nr:hypothetical protein [Stellaceae bacterium]
MENDTTKMAEKLTCSVPEAGAMAGLSYQRSYAAAKVGDIPTITIGGRLKVPLAKWRAKLNGEAA